MVGASHVEDCQGQRCAHEDYRRPGGEAREHIGGGAGTKGGLRALAAEGACEVSRAALLQEDNTDQKQADHDVDDDDEVKEDLHLR